jgi:hypothetical protein
MLIQQCRKSYILVTHNPTQCKNPLIDKINPGSFFGCSSATTVIMNRLKLNGQKCSQCPNRNRQSGRHARGAMLPHGLNQSHSLGRRRRQRLAPPHMRFVSQDGIYADAGSQTAAGATAYAVAPNWRRLATRRLASSGGDALYRSSGASDPGEAGYDAESGEDAQAPWCCSTVPGSPIAWSHRPRGSPALAGVPAASFCPPAH